MDVAIPVIIALVIGGALLWVVIKNQIQTGNKIRKDIEESINQAVSALPQIDWEFDDLISVDIYKKNGALSCREVARLGFSKAARQFMVAWVSAPYDTAGSERQRCISGTWGVGEISNVQIALNEEKSTFTSGKIGGRTGGALLGTMLFGAAGGIVGAAGKREISTQSHEISSVISLALEIQTTNPASPYLYIHFFCAPMSLDKLFDKNSVEKRASIPLDQLRNGDEFQKAQKWYALLSSLFESNREKTREELSDSPSNYASVSEELRRLHDLLKEGVITETEFAAAKKRLLD